MAYGTNAGLETYWDSLGYDYSALSDGDKTALRTSASVYIDSLGYSTLKSGVRSVNWPGEPATSDQLNEWPRKNATDVYGRELSDSTVPVRVESATYEAAYFSFTGGDLNRSSSPDRQVVKQKIDVIDITYSDVSSSGYVDSRPVIPAVEALLSPLLSGSGSNNFGIAILATK